MRCPVDGTTLSISDCSGIEIDWCPQCRGVWLDRGELDKLIERSEERWDDRREERYPRGRDRDRDRGRSGSAGKPTDRKKALLRELLDF